MDIRDLVAELSAKFPRHAREIVAWAPEYARVLSGADIRTSLAATMLRWSKSAPPKPSEIVRKQAGPIGHDGTGPLELPMTGGGRITAAGYAHAKGIKKRILDEMLRTAPAELCADAAVWLARARDAEAWLLAQAQVLDHEPRSLLLTDGECRTANDIAARDFVVTAAAKAHAKAYDDALAKGLPWPPKPAVLSHPIPLVAGEDGVYRASQTPTQEAVTP